MVVLLLVRDAPRLLNVNKVHADGKINSLAPPVGDQTTALHLHWKRHKSHNSLKLTEIVYLSRFLYFML